MRKAYKSILSLAVVLIAGLNIIVPAFAQDPFTGIAVGGLTGASGAGLFGSMAGMSGISIDYVSDPVNDAMWNKLNPDSVYFNGEKHEATGTGEDLWDYITVDIGDWLQAQEDFIQNLADTYNITDNQQGTITGTQTINGVPVYKPLGNSLISDYLLQTSVQIGETSFIGNTNLGLQLTGNTNRVVDVVVYYNGNIVIQTGHANSIGVIYHLVYEIMNGGAYLSLMPGTTDISNRSRIGFPSSPQNVSWESETVNLSVFDGWESAKVKIPKTISQLQPNWTPIEFLDELNRIWYGAGEDNIIIEDGGDVPPVPPVPVPSTPLGDVPFDDWVDLWGQGIYQQLENQSNALDFIGSNGVDVVEELENIDSNLDDLNDTAESIDTNIGIGNGILGGIRSLAQSAINYLEGIAENVGELVEEIVEGTETLIAGILNQIPAVFGVIFGPIKQASSIWHYVVEWIQSISGPMSWMWSMASGTSYNIILPVYASLAGAVVLAFYKRFGK